MVIVEELTQRPKEFRGNWEDLRQFRMLASSPVRSSARAEALASWEQYKQKRQFEAAGSSSRKKGGHMRALISRVIDLTGAKLDEVCIGYADLRGVIFDYCSLRSAWLKGANLENASLRGADFSTLSESGRGAGRLLYAFLQGADLTGAKLCGVDLSFASLNDATLSDADLSDANLSHVSLVRADVTDAVFRNTRVYGIAAWDLKGTPAIQQDLVISQEATLGDKSYYYVLKESTTTSTGSRTKASADRPGPPDSLTQAAVRVDNLELAQFVNLLLRNEKIRDVIDTVGQKGVLILGRFTNNRKRVLDALRKKLRELEFVPMVFDFERPTMRDFTETIKILAGLSRFIIADITDPKSTPLELQATIPDYMIPFVPIIEKGYEPFSMFQDLKQKYGDWVLDILEYDSVDSLIDALDEVVVKPALETSTRLALKKATIITKRQISPGSPS